MEYILPSNVPSIGIMILWTLIALISIPILKLLSILIKPSFSNMRYLPGPPGGSLLTGHINELNKSETDRAECHLEWTKKYGHVYVYKSLLNSDRLTTTDPKALNHILAQYMVYYKPSHLRLTLGALIGEGLIFAEGAAHKRQRRVMNPAFSRGHVVDLTQLFLLKAEHLRDVLASTISQRPSKPVNMVSFISRCTLDIIGLAGFNYDLKSVSSAKEESNEDELASAFAKSNRTDSGYATMQLLYAWIPPLRWVMFDEVSRVADKAQKTMRRIGRGLVEERKKTLSSSSDIEKEDDLGSGSGKDLLSLIVKANMSVDVPVEQRMSDAEVMHQIPTFMVAGHETTATSLIWSFFLISTHPTVQSTLRSELQTLSPNPTYDELNSLPYLDNVLKECIRLYPSFENTLRIAQSDDIVPLEKPFIDRKGQSQDQILMKKGDGVVIPILLMNRLPELWGPDAAQFNPDRWNNLPEATRSIPSVWGSQFSFLGGPRSCIGYRFAIAEMKAIIFTLLTSFEFTLAVDEKDILRASNIATRPMVRGQEDKGSQMPLLVKPLWT